MAKIAAGWFIKLIVVVLRFAETIDDIAEMIEERRPIIRIRLGAIDRDLIGNAKFIGVFTSVRGAQVAAAMENDFPGLFDLSDYFGTMISVSISKPEHVVIGHAR